MRSKKLKTDEFVLPWDGKAPMTIFRHTPPTGDSGLYTTPGDMIKFGQMFLNNGEEQKGTGRFLARCRFFHDARVDWRADAGFLAQGRWGMFRLGPLANSIHRIRWAIPVSADASCLSIPMPTRPAFVLTTSTHLHSDPKNYKKILNVLMAI